MTLNKITPKNKINIQEIGLYLRLIYMEYQPKNNKEMAELITEYFNVQCEEEDVNIYERLYMYQEQEDYEKESRAILYGINIFNQLQI